MGKFTYTFRLTSSSNYINLYRNLTNIKSVKITSMRYTTQSSGALYMLVSLSEFNDKIVLDSGRITYYTKLIMMADVNQAIITYENPNNFPDVEKPMNALASLSSFTLDVLFSLTNGTLTYSPDISSTNPVVIEIEFETDNI